MVGEEGITDRYPNEQMYHQNSDDTPFLSLNISFPVDLLYLLFQSVEESLRAYYLCSWKGRKQSGLWCMWRDWGWGMRRRFDGRRGPHN